MCSNRIQPVSKLNRVPSHVIWVVLVIMFILFIVSSADNTTTTGNPKADKQLELEPEHRPESGHIEFTKWLEYETDFQNYFIYLYNTFICCQRVRSKLLQI